MAVGGTAYAVVAIPTLLATPWRSLSLTAWAMLGWSAVFALFLAYLLWYVGVQRIGSSRTSVYSNLTPVFAMLVAWAWLGEPVVLTQAVGAAAILGGIAVTRWRPRQAPVETAA
jgi:drug/metabolite transporter (DMT)-like permease